MSGGVGVDAAGWSAWPAPAKLNLFLHITGRRPDGYHDLQTVFRLLDWGDIVHLRVRADGRIERQGDTLPGLAAADDLVMRAAEMLRSASNCGKGADIRVEKRIPAGGGFGGGSSDAATVLLALNVLWGLGWSTERLAALGLRLGADVPVFVHGRNAWAEGIGERLVALDLPPAWYLLADPGITVPTAALFADAGLTRNAAPVTIADFASGAPLGNVFEPVLRRREPAVEAVLAALSQAGRARLTGTGSGCFVEFATREAAEAARATLPAGLRTWLVAGVARSPLHDRLEAGVRVHAFADGGRGCADPRSNTKSPGASPSG